MPVTEDNYEQTINDKAQDLAKEAETFCKGYMKKYPTHTENGAFRSYTIQKLASLLIGVEFISDLLLGDIEDNNVGQ